MSLCYFIALATCISLTLSFLVAPPPLQPPCPLALRQVNFIAMNLAKNKKYYKNIKYDHSVDFSSLNTFEYPKGTGLLMDKSVERLQELCTEENILRGGTHEELVIRMFKEKVKDKDEDDIDEKLEDGARRSSAASSGKGSGGLDAYLLNNRGSSGASD